MYDLDEGWPKVHKLLYLIYLAFTLMIGHEYHKIIYCSILLYIYIYIYIDFHSKIIETDAIF